MQDWSDDVAYHVKCKTFSRMRVFDKKSNVSEPFKIIYYIDYQLEAAFFNLSSYTGGSRNL